MKIKRTKSKAHKKAMAHVRAQRGQDREHFFKTNGDFRQWIPRHMVAVNRKREKSRTSCRKFKF